MSQALWILIGVILIADLVLLPPFIARSRRKEMDETARVSAPGNFTTLSRGVTHYQWHGPKSAEIIVLVHGLSAPSFVFSALIPFLTKSGFCILTYDLYGRGWSDRPRDHQTAAFFTRQLSDLLDDQMVSKPVTILGYSMGGAIASSFALEHSDRVHKLILLASAGFNHQTGGMTDFICRTPLIGDWLMTVFGGARLRKSARLENAQNQNIPDIAARMAQETRYRGYTRSILSSLRYLLGHSFDGLHQALATKSVSTLAIWGQEDEAIPVSSAARLSAANPAVKTVILEGADHALAYVLPETVAEQVLTFLDPNIPHNGA